MLLKYLELSGFKSFPDRTRIEFGTGLTAVVGPNGSGKSNISDAVRWVLGEQSTKTLRGEKMEDVIFSGTKTRKAQGFAEVSLMIDNTDRALDLDSDEVVVTRRYDRSGESEYLLNRSVVRLRDVQEIFMDTGLGKDGYSLVGQGRIAEIVQSKSTQRREIFEEAAGIAKFRYRKNEAERSLARAEENLARLRDILSELESRLAPLKEQSEKAKRYLELAEQKKSLEISIWVQSIEQSNRAIKDQSDKLLICTQRRDECLVGMEALRGERSSLMETIASRSADAAVCENDIRHNEERIAQMEREIASLNENADTARSALAQRQSEAEKLAEETASLADEVRRMEEKREAAAAETQQAQTDEGACMTEIHALNVEKTATHMAASAAAESLAQLFADAERRKEAAVSLRQDAQQYEEQIKTAQSLVETLNDRMLSTKNSQAGLRLKQQGRAQKLAELQKEESRFAVQISEREQKQKLLSAMEQSLDGYAYSVKEILKRSKSGVLSGIWRCLPPCRILSQRQRRTQKRQSVFCSGRILAAQPFCRYPPCGDRGSPTMVLTGMRDTSV